MHVGWYRVNYDKNNWDLLIQQLNDDHEKLDSNSRAQLLDDSFNLGRAELIDQTVFLEITKYLTKETYPLAFIPAFNGLNTISNLIVNEFETNELFKVIFIFIIFLLAKNYILKIKNRHITKKR